MKIRYGNQSTCPISTKFGTNYPWWRFLWEIVEKRLWRLIKSLLFAFLFTVKNCFSRERCGPWAFLHVPKLKLTSILSIMINELIYSMDYNICYYHIYFLFETTGVYFTCAMLLVSMSCLMTVVVLNLHFKGSNGKKVPRYMRSIFGILAKLVFFKIRTNDPAEPRISVKEVTQSLYYCGTVIIIWLLSVFFFRHLDISYQRIYKMVILVLGFFS